MNLLNLALTAIFWSYMASAAAGPDVNRRSFLLGTATSLAALKAPSLKFAPIDPVAPLAESPLLSRIGNVIFLNPLSTAELRMIADIKLKDYGIALNQLLTDDAFEHLLQIRYDINQGVRGFDYALKELISVYDGEPITFDQLRFYLEDVPLPEAQPPTRSPALDQLRRRLLSSCAYLLVHPHGVELLPRSSGPYD